MTIQKSILYTTIFYVFIQILSFWILVLPASDYRFLIVKSSPSIDSLLTLFILFIIFKYIDKTDFLKFNRIRIKYLLFAVILGIGFVYIQPILGIIFNHEFSTNIYDFKFLFEKLKSINTLDLILLTPIVEELFFRNLIQKRLSKNYKPIISIVVTGFLFSMIHIPFPALFIEYIDFSLYHAYFALFGGLLCGIIYYKSESTFPSILFHMIWNLMIIIT